MNPSKFRVLDWRDQLTVWYSKQTLGAVRLLILCLI
jgi:hypothetical protein